MPSAGVVGSPSYPGVGGSGDPAAAQAGIVRDFRQAWEAADIDALIIGLLDPGATVIADGGGLVNTALRPIEGGERVAHYLVDIAGRAPSLGHRGLASQLFTDGCSDSHHSWSNAASPRRHSGGDRWFVDESYVKVSGVWRYWYRAIDQFGQVIDGKRRDTRAARGFFEGALVCAARHRSADRTVDEVRLATDGWPGTLLFARGSVLALTARSLLDWRQLRTPRSKHFQATKRLIWSLAWLHCPPTCWPTTSRAAPAPPSYSVPAAAWVRRSPPCL